VEAVEIAVAAPAAPAPPELRVLLGPRAGGSRSRAALAVLAVAAGRHA
jgi:hypothetical protein